MYRPEVRGWNPLFEGTPQIVITNSRLSLGWLGIHGMSFENFIYSDFSGTAGYTQLISGSYHSTITISTIGYEADNAEWYDPPVTLHLGRFWAENGITFADSPGIGLPTLTSTASMNLAFKDYLRFEPDAGPGPNIYVTLRFQTWGVSASATKTDGVWSVDTGSSTTGPTDSDSQDFPYWWDIFFKLMNSKMSFFVILNIAGFAGFLCAADSTVAPMTNSAGQLGPGFYRIGADGGHHPETNANEFWPGPWTEGTNGWRVQLYCGDTNSPSPWAFLSVGSTITNSGGGYCRPPNGEVPRFELRDANGVIVSQKKKTLFPDKYPLKIPVSNFPKLSSGTLKGLFGFFSNSPPAKLQEFKIYDVYQVPREGDYTVSVCPAIYKYDGDNMALINLPCISTKIHLRPSPSE